MVRDYYYYYYVRNVMDVKAALQNAVHFQTAVVVSAALLTSPCL